MLINNNLSIVQEIVYEPCGFELINLQNEAESREYNACRFELNEVVIFCRKSKITPTKTGQFVTFWKRIKDGPIQPFEDKDDFDFFVVNVRKGCDFGQFVFPKSYLITSGIISKNGNGGKRAIRVYPPWDEANSKQAKKTQKRQLNYFLKIDQAVNLNQARRLYSINSQNSHAFKLS